MIGVLLELHQLLIFYEIIYISLRRNKTIDGQKRELARVKIRMLIKKLKKT
jgi:hypothetical protein